MAQREAQVQDLTGTMHCVLGKTLHSHSASLNPLTPISDQDRISPHNINTISIQYQADK